MSAATSLEQNLAAAVKDGKIPHAVVFATNADGMPKKRTSNISCHHPSARLTSPPPTDSFQYSHAVGKTSVDKTDTSNAKDIQDDAVFLLASQTKLLTAFSAMLVVERGLIGFDDDVSELLPELGEQKVLRGFEDDGQGGERAVLEEREGKLTLRYVHQAESIRCSRATTNTPIQTPPHSHSRNSIRRRRSEPGQIHVPARLQRK